MQKVVVAIVENKNDGVLLVERCKEDGVKYSFPSGKVNPDETEEAAVEREVEEETGQIVKANCKLGERVSPFNTDVMLVYWQCMVAREGAIVVPQKEIVKAWFADKQTLTQILGENIYPPVKEHLQL